MSRSHEDFKKRIADRFPKAAESDRLSRLGSFRPIYEKWCRLQPITAGWEWAGDHWIIDVTKIGERVEEGLYKLNLYVQGADYSDYVTSEHIRSIGVDKGGRIWAATDGRFVDNSNYQLLWVA